MSVLNKICAAKRAHVAARRAAVPLEVLEMRAAQASAPRGFRAALVAQDGPALIAEVKRASPSKGPLFPDADAAAVARAYAAGGATCLSVLTDTPYFGGRDADLPAARAAVPLPVLRKDFMLEPYQITESRALGADCVLLILAALDDRAAHALYVAARDWGMDVLVEVHDAQELDRAVALGADLIGVNARDLTTLAVDLTTPRTLAPQIPPYALAVAESGIGDHATLTGLHAAGYKAFLVGEALMRAGDTAAATRALLGQV